MRYKESVLQNLGAHNDAERTKGDCCKRLIPNRNNLKQNMTKKMYGFKSNFTSFKTEYHRMSIFVLHYLRLEKHALIFPYENVTFQQSKSSSIPVDKKIY
jgi:hypothetical protein